MVDDIGNLLIKSKQNREIAQIAKDKAYFGASISRYYYSLYQMMMYVIRKKDVSYSPVKSYDSDKSDSHVKTYNKFIEIVNKHYNDKLHFKERLNINSFKTLKDFRVKADYQIEMIDDSEFSAKFLSKYDPFYRVLEKIKSF